MDVDPEGAAKPIPVVVSTPKEDSRVGSASDSEDSQDVPGDRVTATIWRNAKGGFQEFRPECFAHCYKNTKSMACPGPYDMDNLSDDEEWLKTDCDMPSVNTF